MSTVYFTLYGMDLMIASAMLVVSDVERGQLVVVGADYGLETVWSLYNIYL